MPENKYKIQHIHLLEESHFLSENIKKCCYDLFQNSSWFYKIQSSFIRLCCVGGLGMKWVESGFCYDERTMHDFFVVNKALELLYKYNFEDWLSYQKSGLGSAVSRKINFLILKGTRNS